MHASFLVLLGLLAGPDPVSATAADRPPCHDYRQIVETLDKRYGETPASLGLQGNGHILQLFTSPAGGSWTILTVAPDGTGCIIAAGHDWRSRAPAAQGPAV